MRLGDLDRAEIRSRFSGDGLLIQTGPFVIRLKSSLEDIADGVAQLYADFPIADQGQFVDVTLSVNLQRGLWGWFFPRGYVLPRGRDRATSELFPPRLGLSYLEWGLNYSIYAWCMRYLVLHSAVLEREGHGLIILGDSGDGKSTLCSGLALSGWRLLSDELGLVDLSDGQLSPLARPISLKNESIETIRNFSTDAVLTEPRLTRRKGLLAHLKPPTESVELMHQRMTPTTIVTVKYAAGEPLQVEPLDPSAAFQSLLRSGFNYFKLGEAGFHSAVRLINSCECISIRYSQLPEVLDYFQERIPQASACESGT